MLSSEDVAAVERIVQRVMRSGSVHRRCDAQIILDGITFSCFDAHGLPADASVVHHGQADVNPLRLVAWRVP